MHILFKTYFSNFKLKNEECILHLKLWSEMRKCTPKSLYYRISSQLDILINKLIEWDSKKQTGTPGTLEPLLFMAYQLKSKVVNYTCSYSHLDQICIDMRNLLSNIDKNIRTKAKKEMMKYVEKLYVQVMIVSTYQ